MAGWGARSARPGRAARSMRARAPSLTRARLPGTLPRPSGRKEGGNRKKPGPAIAHCRCRVQCRRNSGCVFFRACSTSRSGRCRWCRGLCRRPDRRSPSPLPQLRPRRGVVAPPSQQVADGREACTGRQGGCEPVASLGAERVPTLGLRCGGHSLGVHHPANFGLVERRATQAPPSGDSSSPLSSVAIANSPQASMMHAPSSPPAVLHLVPLAVSTQLVTGVCSAFEAQPQAGGGFRFQH